MLIRLFSQISRTRLSLVDSDELKSDKNTAHALRARERSLLSVCNPVYDVISVFLNVLSCSVSCTGVSSEIQFYDNV